MVAVKLVTANISPALAILAINTLAPARATPVVPAPPAVVNIQNARVPVVIVGMAAVALFLAPPLINTLVLVPAMPEAQVPLAEVNIQSALAQVATNGKMAVVRRLIFALTKLMEHITKYIVAMVRWLALMPAA